MDQIPPTDRTTVRRLPARGSYDRALIHAILDEAPVCHVGFVVNGRPFVIPTLHVRVGDRLYIHGSPAAGCSRRWPAGPRSASRVTLIDGLVLARSAFHHSMNYRSVVVFGVPAAVDDPEEKTRVLQVAVGAPRPGALARRPRPEPGELKATSILSLPIDEASAKVRTGPPVDDEEDYALPAWAGVVPLSIAGRRADPVPAAVPGIEPPTYARSYPGPGAGSRGGEAS